MTGNKRFYLDENGINDREYEFSVLGEDELVDIINELNDGYEQLKKVLGAILLEVKRDISNTNQTGEIKVFINPNSFDLISEVLKKYGALKEWYNE